MSAVNQALLTADLDERQLMALLATGQWTGLAALGIVVDRVVRVIIRDRIMLRGWLSEVPEGVA